MKSTPFKRSILMMHAISAAMAAGMSAIEAGMSVGEYKSRGKGLGRRSGKKPGNACTTFRDKADFHRPDQSKACSRRRLQMARSINASAA